MLNNYLNSFVGKLSDQKISDIYHKMLFLSAHHFHDYEPTSGPHPDFLARLENWIKNVDTDTGKKTLFKLFPFLFYVGKKEMDNLYRIAYNQIVARWLVEKIKISFDDPTPEKKLKNAVGETAFFPITDSMRINQFFNINSIPAKQGIRPDWRTLERLGDPEKIEKFISKSNIKRIVLMEDFVGSGTQVKKALIFATSLLHTLPILFVPLIICPKGVALAKKIEKNHKNLTVRPVLELHPSNFIFENQVSNENEEFSEIRNFLVRQYTLTSGGTLPNRTEKAPYGPFGFEKTGGFVVLNTNTPDNTLPVIHWKSSTWNPLFPRHSRE